MLSEERISSVVSRVNEPTCVGSNQLLKKLLQPNSGQSATPRSSTTATSRRVRSLVGRVLVLIVNNHRSACISSIATKDAATAAQSNLHSTRRHNRNPLAGQIRETASRSILAAQTPTRYVIGYRNISSLEHLRCGNHSRQAAWTNPPLYTAIRMATKFGSSLSRSRAALASPALSEPTIPPSLVSEV